MAEDDNDSLFLHWCFFNGVHAVSCCDKESIGAAEEKADSISLGKVCMCVSVFCLVQSRDGTHNEVTFNISAIIPEICAFNNIAGRPKSAICSSLKVRIRCAYGPRSVKIMFFLFDDSNLASPLGHKFL